jgi:hypothetical protein
MNIEEGDFAYYDNKELIDNPYEVNSDEYNQWEFGWLGAQEGSAMESKYIREDYDV